LQPLDAQGIAKVRVGISIRELKSNEAGHVVSAAVARIRSHQRPTAQAVSVSVQNVIYSRVLFRLLRNSSANTVSFIVTQSKDFFVINNNETFLQYKLLSQRKQLHLICLRPEKLIFIK
jgi:hypothetical protein